VELNVIYKSEKFKVLIDDRDADLVTKGCYIQKTREKSGLLYLRVFASKNGFKRRHSDMRLLHILVVEKVLGRKLKPNEVIHHINGNPFDCRRDNLLVMRQSEHARLHMVMSVEYAKNIFQSLSSDEKLQLLEKLLSRKTRDIRGIFQVIGPGKDNIITDEEIVHTHRKIESK